MTRPKGSIRNDLLTCSMLVVAHGQHMAADVTAGAPPQSRQGAAELG